MAGLIAIVGIGCRFPGGADTPETFWSLLRDGVDAVGPVPSWRWDAAKFYDPDRNAPGKMYVREGGFLTGDNITKFDSRLFRMSPREAESVDPQQRLLLEVAWEALENAGQSAAGLEGSRTGVFVGSFWDDYSAERFYRVPLSGIDAFNTIAGVRSMAAGRIAHALNLQGPSVYVDTACSASLLAVHLAGASLRNGECDLALAGGVSLILSPRLLIGNSRMNAIASTGRCKSFAGGTDGFGRGEGCGVVVLKRYADAVRDGDTILACIRGSAVNHCGRSLSLTTPTIASQRAVIQSALSNAGVEPGQIQYLEAHGAGTPLGDPIEMAAIGEVFGPVRETPLLVGSVKTNIAHLDPAAGVSGLIKVALAMQHGAIPGNLHFDPPNPMIRWGRLPVKVPVALTPWYDSPKLAGVSSFGLSGTNVHVVLEEPARKEEPVPEPERSHWMLPLSAISEEALGALALKYQSHLAGSSPSLADICYTAAVGRSHFEHRVALVSGSVTQLREQINSLVAGDRADGIVRLRRGQERRKPRIAFLFTGQGAQYINMGRQLYSTHPLFRRTIDQCDRILRPWLERSLLSVLYPDGPDDGALSRTSYAQPALFAIEYALAKLWRSWGIEPDAVLGHSTGELIAACVAGVYSLEDGLKFVAERARLIESVSGSSATAAALAGVERVQAVVDSIPGVDVAGINSPLETLIAGHAAAVEQAIGILTGDGIECRRLPITHAPHSPLMDPILDEFEAVARQIEYRTPKCVYVSNVTGEAVDAIDAQYWRRHLREPVRFTEGMARLAAEGCNVLLEAGPQPILQLLGRQSWRGAKGVAWLSSLWSVQDDWAQLLSSAAELYVRGANLDWLRFEREAGSVGVRRKIALPTYPFQRERCWTVVKEALGIEDAMQHPLLGAPISSAVLKPSELLFESTLSAQKPQYLDGHRAFDRVLLPGSAYIEMALAFAALSNLPSRDRQGVVENVAFERALPLPAEGVPAKVQFLATPSRSGHRWEIYSTAAANTPWTRHASGTVRTSADTPLLTIAAEPGEPVDPAVLYADFERNNLHYGPDFRLIRRLWRSETAIRAEVQLTPHLARDAARYQLHPALLDACMHASALLFLKDGPSASVFLPVAFDKIVFRRTGKPITELLCDARLRSISPLVIDLALSTRSGDTVASIEGMQVKETDAQVLAEREPWRDWMYRLAWEPQEAAPAGSRAGSHWLILSDSREFAEPLASALQSAGAEVTLAGTLPQPLPPITGIVHAFSKAETSTSCDRLLSLVQTLGVSGKLPPLWIVTKGAVAAGPRHGLDGLKQSPLWGLARVIGLEYSPAQPVCVDLDPSASLQENVAKLAADLSATPPEDQVAYRSGMRYVARLTRLQAAQAEQRRVPGSGEIEIELTAAGLNFRDVLMSLNLYPGPPAPMGLEGAGRVATIGPNAGDFKIGDRVMVIQPGCFQSHLTVDHRLAVKIPDRITDIEAATIPSAFVTAWHCLSHLARLKPVDRVLIHTGAGGIGQAAIRIAQLAGAEIYSTASPSKWPALRSLGVEHIYNSRTTDFGREILAATEGRGVSVILNTLTGPGFVEQSLAALAQGGCFLEISKRDVWNALRMASARSDVNYHLVDQAEILVKAPDLVHAQLRTLADLFEQGKLEPMERTVFEMHDRASAFRMMETARHTGKIVLVHESRRAVSIDPEATYLITGGAGGLGLVTARGLIEQGARRLILVNRRLPGAAAETAITELRAMGANVIAEAADVSDFARMESLVADIPKEHPLKGVIHAAGFLDDGLLVNQSPERFAKVMAPKIDGAWNLHRLTASLTLDFFVMFSSASSLLGHVGQANYAAANAFLDSLAHYRHSLGLPALAINWGVWADVGSAAQFTQQLATLGFDAIQPKQGPAIIEHLLGVPDAQVGVIGLNWNRFDARRPFFTHVRQESRRTESEEDLPALNDAPALTAYIRRQVASILRYATPESVPTRQGFRELGMDSLTSMELRNRLQNALDRELPPAVIFNHPTVEALAHFLTGGGETAVQEAPAAQVQSGSEMRERTVSVNGLDLCLCEWGTPEGRLALLIHGTRDHAASWAPIAQALAADGYRVVAPDLRGHGRSGHCALSSRYHLGDFVSDLVQIVERLGEQPALLAGHSLGAIIAVLYASANPKGAKRLVLVEPPLSPIADDSQSFIEQLAAYSRAAAEVRGHSTMPDLQAAADRLRQVTPGMPPEVAMSRAQRLTEPSRGGLVWRWDARFDGPGNVDTLFAGLRKGEYLRMMAGLAPPVTTVYGDSSGWISRDERALMAAALPVARVTVLPGGHNVHLDSPAALSLAILQEH